VGRRRRRRKRDTRSSNAGGETSVFVIYLVIAQAAMAATVDGVVLEELRTEIERLSRELDLASTEKVQSAQYGLALLEEKSALQQRCNDLEALYENTKHELEITQEVSASPGPFGEPPVTRHARGREKIYSALATVFDR